MTDIQVKVLAYDTVISRPMIKTLLNLDLLRGFLIAIVWAALELT